MDTPKRTVLCEDAISWLRATPVDPGQSFVSSLPDISEFPQFTLSQWKDWFIQTAQLILRKTPEEGVAVFFQSDVKNGGEWVDKSYLCQKAAESLGHRLLWHKIACRSPAGTPSFNRPSYSHILCFSKGLQIKSSYSSADVLPQLGDKSWERGMGLEACMMVAKFISQETQTRCLVNPFCGHGSMLAAAEHFGLSSLGIERSPKRADRAQRLSVSTQTKPWSFVLT